MHSRNAVLEAPPTSEYTMGYSEEFLQLLHRRSAETHAVASASFDVFSAPEDVAFFHDPFASPAIGSSDSPAVIAAAIVDPAPTSDAWGTFAKLVAGNGGHPQMGKELKNAFIEAGFTNVRASASFDIFSTPEDVAFFHGFTGDWFHSPAVIAAAIKYGLATQEQFDGWRVALDQWKYHPGAVGGIAFGEAIASKP